MVAATVDKKVTIWKQEDCPMCEKAFTHYKELGYDIDTKDVAKLLDGTEPDMDAIVQLSMQGMSVPIVRESEDMFISVDNFK